MGEKDCKQDRFLMVPLSWSGGSRYRKAGRSQAALCPLQETEVPTTRNFPYRLESGTSSVLGVPARTRAR